MKDIALQSRLGLLYTKYDIAVIKHVKQTCKLNMFPLDYCNLLN